MSFFKDLYIKLLEEEMAELEAQGVPPDKAYDLAGERAYDNLRGRLRQRLDDLEQRCKAIKEEKND
jgi:hypothetical protein